MPVVAIEVQAQENVPTKATNALTPHKLAMMRWEEATKAQRGDAPELKAKSLTPGKALGLATGGASPVFLALMQGRSLRPWRVRLRS